MGVDLLNIEGLKDMDRQAPVVMVNLMRFRERSLDGNGSGWDAYGEAIRARLPSTPRWADGSRFPQARDVVRLAAPQLAAGKGVAPEDALPVYLRDKVALTLEEQGAAKQ